MESWAQRLHRDALVHDALGDFQTAAFERSCVQMADGSLGYPYTLNNPAVASPRILIPLLENHQEEDGSVTLPESARSVHARQGEASFRDEPNDASRFDHGVQ